MMIKVAVDAMGGDYAPAEMVAGAVAAVNANKGIQVLLVGERADCIRRTFKASVSERTDTDCKRIRGNRDGRISG